MRLPSGGETALGKIVAVHDRGHAPGLAGQPQVTLEPLGQPGTSRGDAHQARVGLAQAAHPLPQLLVKGLGIKCESGQGRLLKNCSRIMAAAAASASLAPMACASVVL